MFLVAMFLVVITMALNDTGIQPTARMYIYIYTLPGIFHGGRVGILWIKCDIHMMTIFYTLRF